MRINSLLILSLISFFTLITNRQAKADILIEPFLGIEQSTDGGGGSNPTFGARLGFDFMGLAVGAQYSSFNGKGDFPNSSGIEESHDYSGTKLGAFVSYQFPISFRVFAAYILNSQSKLKAVSIDPDGPGGISEAAGDLDFKGKGNEIGLSYTGLPFVTLNLSMSTIKNDEVDHPIENTPGVNITSDEDAKTYLLTLSFPFSI